MHLLAVAQQLLTDLSADTDLLEIRAHTTAAHALTVDNDSRWFWQVLNVGIALGALAIVVALGFLLRRRTLPVIQEAA